MCILKEHFPLLRLNSSRLGHEGDRMPCALVRGSSGLHRLDAQGEFKKGHGFVPHQLRIDAHLCEVSHSPLHYARPGSLSLDGIRTLTIAHKVGAMVKHVSEGRHLERHAPLWGREELQQPSEERWFANIRPVMTDTHPRTGSRQLSYFWGTPIMIGTLRSHMSEGMLRHAVAAPNVPKA